MSWPHSGHRRRRRKSFFRGIFTLVVAIGLTSPGMAQADTKGSPTLVSLGDSITFGYNLGTNNNAPSHLAFPFVVAQDEGWQAIDLGVPGWTSNDLLQALATPQFQSSIQKASTVTIDIGSNDLLHAAGNLLANNNPANSSTQTAVTAQEKEALTAAVAQFSKNLPAIVAAVREMTSATIVLVNLYDPFPDGSSLHAVAEAPLSAANQVIYETAASTGCLVVDAYSAFNHRQTSLVRVQQQDVHPTASGQSVLAQGIEATLSTPLASEPNFYAIAPHGAVIRTSATDAAPAIAYLSGLKASLVTGVNNDWLKVVAPTGSTGYVQKADVHLLLRPWNNVSFHKTAASVRVGTVTANGILQNRIAHLNQVKVINWNDTLYVPVASLAHLIGAKTKWDNLNREVSIITPDAAGIYALNLVAASTSTGAGANHPPSPGNQGGAGSSSSSGGSSGSSGSGSSGSGSSLTSGGTASGSGSSSAGSSSSGTASSGGASSGNSSGTSGSGQKQSGTGTASSSSSLGNPLGSSNGLWLSIPGNAPLQTVQIRTEGIEIDVDGEPLPLQSEAVIWNGNVYVSASGLWQRFGGVTKPSPLGLALLLPTDS